MAEEMLVEIMQYVADKVTAHYGIEPIVVEVGAVSEHAESTWALDKDSSAVESHDRVTTIRSGTHMVDTMLVLLHELAHFIVPYERHGRCLLAHHDAFFDVSAQLYCDFGVPLDHALRRCEMYGAACCERVVNIYEGREQWSTSGK